MLELLLSRRAITICEVIALVLLLFLIIRQSKKQRDILERIDVNEQKHKISQLDQMLRNKDINQDITNRPKPYQVQYTSSSEKEMKHVLPKFQIEIEVYRENSIQRHLFDLTQNVLIGRAKECVLPIKDPEIAERSCEIFMKQQEVVVRNCSPNHPIYIHRGKSSQKLEKHPLFLQSKDILMLGHTRLQIVIYKN